MREFVGDGATIFLTTHDMTEVTEQSFAAAFVHSIVLVLIISILLLVACTVWNKFTMRS